MMVDRQIILPFRLLAANAFCTISVRQALEIKANEADIQSFDRQQ